MYPALHGHLLRLFTLDLLLRQPLAIIKQQIPRLFIKVAVARFKYGHQILFLFEFVIDALLAGAQNRVGLFHICQPNLNQLPLIFDC